MRSIFIGQRRRHILKDIRGYGFIKSTRIPKLNDINIKK